MASSFSHRGAVAGPHLRLGGVDAKRDAERLGGIDEVREEGAVGVDGARPVLGACPGAGASATEKTSALCDCALPCQCNPYAAAPSSATATAARTLNVKPAHAVGRLRKSCSKGSKVRHGAQVRAISTFGCASYRGRGLAQ